jgi:uncharacterized lipoprotein YajG
MTMPRLLALIPLLLLLSSCATTDQRVTIAPEPPRLEPAALGNAGAVALDVVDARDDRQLGSIQALEGPPASITSSQDVAYATQLAAATALSNAGFRPTPWSDNAEPRLLIQIEHIEHTVGAGVPREVSTEVRLSARAWQQGRQYSASAESSVSDTVAIRPSAEANAAAIETAVTEALRRLMDRKLLEFLAGR